MTFCNFCCTAGVHIRGALVGHIVVSEWRASSTGRASPIGKASHGKDDKRVREGCLSEQASRILAPAK